MSDEKKYRTEIPNIIDDLGLNPYERALYVHYKRVCGANGGQCTEGVRGTAERTKISVGKVVPTRQALIDRGLISGEVKHGKDTSITVVDIWDINTAYYADKTRPSVDGWTVDQLKQWVIDCSGDEQLSGDCSRGEQNCSGDEQHCSRGEQKKEPIKKEPIKKEPPKKSKSPKAPPTESQEMFKTLAEVCQYDIKLITKDERGKLNQAEKKMRENGYTPDDLKGFERWWYANDWRGKQRQAPTLSQVREAWGRYRNHLNGNGHGQPPKPKLKITAIQTGEQIDVG